MPKMAILPEHIAALSDVAKCSHCGRNMTLTGENYVCPSNEQDIPDSCPTVPVDGERLVRRVIHQSLKRVLTHSNIQSLVTDVQETLQPATVMQQERLRIAESAVERLNTRKEELLRSVDDDRRPDHDEAKELAKIEAEIAGFAYESQIARQELDKLNLIGNQAGLTQTARDPATFLDHADPQDTRDLVNMFIQDVLVGTGSVEIVYSIPVRDQDARETFVSDLLVLD